MVWGAVKMAAEDRFRQSIINTLSRRAANRCSNPDCGVVTCGPSGEADSAVNLGEAAHIYGANPGSARFDPNMSSIERSAIANAIWLCCNCHKLIDDDPLKYPAGLLFEWQKDHERMTAEQIGRRSIEVRHRYEKRHLEEFGRLSYLAERLIIEKDDYWEYLLTAEVLRYEISPIISRWNSLRRGLYVKPFARIGREESFGWLSSKSEEICGIAKAFGNLTNLEFKRAWGETGVAGNDVEIVNVCRLFGEVCASALAWEESVRFAFVDASFVEVKNQYIGVAGTILENAEKIPKFLVDTFASKPVSGAFNLVLTLSLPDGWVDSVESALTRASGLFLKSR